MNTKEMVVQVFDELGYKVQEQDNGSLVVTYQMKEMLVLMEEDSNYMLLMLPMFHEIKEGEETIALALCNRVNREMKLVKVYVDQTAETVTAVCEFYYTDKESLKNNVDMSLQILGLVRMIYRNMEMECVK